MVKTPSTKTSPAKTLDQILWGAADKRRSKLEAAEHRRIVVGLVFPMHVSDTFPASRQWVKPESSFKSCGIQMERR